MYVINSCENFRFGSRGVLSVHSEQARQLNINGWVKNCLDGSVEALFEGNAAQIDRMLAWCEEGPPHARVEQVDI